MFVPNWQAHALQRAIDRARADARSHIKVNDRIVRIDRVETLEGTHEHRYREALETIAELTQTQIAYARAAAERNAQAAEPERRTTLEQQLAGRLAAAQSKWLTIDLRRPE
jgi:hypothetical protein